MRHTALALLATLIVGAAQAAPGHEFAVTIRPRTKDQPRPPITLPVQIVGDRARIDFPEKYDEFQKGDYVITVDGGRSFTLVSPARRSRTEVTDAALFAAIEKEKGLQVSDPVTIWSTPETDQQQLQRRFEIRYRQGIFSGTVLVEEMHRFTAASPGTVGFNPVIPLILLQSDGILMKSAAFRQAGRDARVPKGFVTNATLTSQTKEGKKTHINVTEVQTSAPTPAQIPDDRFAVPSDYRPRKL